MNKTTFNAHLGKKNEAPLTLRVSDHHLVLRTRSSRSLHAGPVKPPAAAFIQDAKLVMEFPEAGVSVYELATGTENTLQARKERLNHLSEVWFAGTGLVHAKTGEPVVYTENIFIKFTDETNPETCRKMLAAENLTIKRALGYAANAFFVSAREGTGTGVFDIANRLLKHRSVEYCHPELIWSRSMRKINDNQWHLKSTVINGQYIAAGVSVDEAHKTSKGAGIVIAIIDDGIDVDHPEFAGGEKMVSPRDVTMGNGDPRPKFASDNHGTACAGVAVANGAVGASGVAPEAAVMPIRLSSALGAQQEGDAFVWAADNGADIISCSWGPADGDWFNPEDPHHHQPHSLPASTRLAIDYAATKGRNGKGCVILFAAGNGNESVDLDGYASYEQVIAIGACNDQSKRSVYSDFGESLHCVFPSSDFGHEPFQHPEPLTRGIWTTDRSASGGYNPGDDRLGDAAGMFTNSFGGTSSSCPGAAGVAALILAINPELTQQEVKAIFSKSCDQIDPEGGAYGEDGKSKWYGYGRLNAKTAVAQARRSSTDTVRISRTMTLRGDEKQVTVPLEVPAMATAHTVSVFIEMPTPEGESVALTVVPPVAMSRKKIQLPALTGGRGDAKVYHAQNTPELASLAGKKIAGKWALMIRGPLTGLKDADISFGLRVQLREGARKRGGKLRRPQKRKTATGKKA